MCSSSTTEVTSKAEAPATVEGRYIYCVADSGEKASLGEIGIDGNKVHTIPYGDICAVAHRCPAVPYQSSDQQVVKQWVMAHQRVVDAAWQRWGNVLPLTFDTIVKGQDGDWARRNVEDWLTQEYDRLKARIDKVRDKAEFGVQVSWNTSVIARSLAETSPEIRSLREEIGSKPRGLAYMYRQKLESLLKKEMEAKADQCFKDCYGRIRRYVADIRVEKTKQAEPGWQMILNLSCLVQRGGYAELGRELEQVKNTEGFSVRFSGPWPPYSFVGGV